MIVVEVLFHLLLTAMACILMHYQRNIIAAAGKKKGMQIFNAREMVLTL